MKYFLPVIIILSISFNGFAQNMFRPSNHEISNSPNWVQMMYGDNPNVFEVDKAYRDYFKGHEFEKSYHTQYYKRWRRSVEEYVNVTGFIEAPTEQEAYREREEMLLASETLGRAGNWSLVGPLIAYNTNGNPVSQQSNVYSIDQAPTNSDILYCGTETGECYRSDDGGHEWYNVTLNELLNGGIR